MARLPNRPHYVPARPSLCPSVRLSVSYKGFQVENNNALIFSLNSVTQLYADNRIIHLY